MYLDYYYIVLVLPAVLFSLWASARVNSTFKKYSGIRNRLGMTGADAARRVLDANGLQYIRVERVSGSLTDHYDPKEQVIRLSDDVYNVATPAAVGVAAHEAGHAVQHAVGYTPIRIRTAIVPITNIGSRISIPLIMIGLLLSIYGEQYLYIAYAGVIAFSLCVVFQLVTLPTEFDASRRAVGAIETSGLLTAEECRGAKKVLRAAAMTYVAALAVSIMQLLRLFLIVAGNKRKD